MARELLRLSRTIHLYLGVFITPALIFFAVTGALQTFSLHETTRGSDYKPPRWAVVLGQIHKKQTSIVPERRPAPPAAASTKPSPPKPADIPTGPVGPTRHPLPLKIFFLTVAVGLLTSSVSGIYMAYQYTRNKRLITALLVTGMILPVILVFV